MNCPKCQHPHFVKNAFVNSTQRYKCKACHYQWTRTTPRGHPTTHKRLSVLLYCHGISMNAIAELFEVSTTAVLKWIRNFAKKQAPKPKLVSTLNKKIIGLHNTKKYTIFLGKKQMNCVRELGSGSKNSC
ncbi:IS1 family transposase [Candidatus Poribacteria bacterium]|nr:IS1 family transposase [Candidatus Poribacteria bacterium]